MRTPAEVFPVGHFLQEEMDARGWGLEDLLNRMPGDRRLNQLHVELILAASKFDIETQRDLRIGDTSALAHAFGTSKEFWTNLDEAYVKFLNQSKP